MWSAVRREVLWWTWALVRLLALGSLTWLAMYLACSPRPAPAQRQSSGDPRLAVVRFTLKEWVEEERRWREHTFSGVVVDRTSRCAWVLTVAHGFESRSGRYMLAIDAPWPRNAAPQIVRMRITKIDKAMDLAVVKLETGNLPNVCYVATRPPLAGARCTSVGYTEDDDDPSLEDATITEQGRLTVTKEAPWHGRSGGALIDASGRLVGLAAAYDPAGCPYNEEREPAKFKAWVLRYAPGYWISHQTIWKFMQWPAPRGLAFALRKKTKNHHQPVKMVRAIGRRKRR